MYKGPKKLLTLGLVLCLSGLMPAETILASGAVHTTGRQIEEANEESSEDSEFISNRNELSVTNESADVQKKSANTQTQSTDTQAKPTDTQVQSTDSQVQSADTQTPSTDLQIESTDSQTESNQESVQDISTSEQMEPQSQESDTKNSAEKASELESETEAPDLDYILGRPMTPEELAAQKEIAVPSGSLASTNLPVLPQTGLSRSYAASYPTSYDSRSFGFTTPIKDQGSWNTCWVFAPLAVGEINLLKKGVVNKDIDLSERQLAYFFYFTQVDPLGLTTGDISSSIRYSYLQGGGNNIFTIFSLAKWIGAADESKVPYGNYNQNNQPPAVSKNFAYDDVAHLQNAFIVPSASISDMKSLITDYGAVTANLYMDSVDYWNYYNPNTAAYCYLPSGYPLPQNHTATIIGWDDDYRKENFIKGKQPKRNGAWLVKNSWGTSWGKDGYFWLSYEDAFLNSSATNSDAAAYTFDFEKADNYDHNYQYDGTSAMQFDSYSEPVTLANVYTAKGNATSADELLEAVSYSTYTAGVTYEVQIYKNLKNKEDPSSGTPMFQSWQRGSTPYAGYTTIRLNQPVTLTQGDTFSVVIRLTPPNGQKLNVFMDRSFRNGDWINFTASSNPNQSFVKPDSKKKWYDAATDLTSNGKKLPSTVRIKAFTSDLTTTSPKKIKLKASTTKPVVGKDVTISAAFTPKKGTVNSTTWTSSNTKVIKVKTSGKKQAVVSAVGYGTAIVTAMTDSGITSTVKLTVSNPAFTKLSSKGYNSITLNWAKVYGAKGYYIYRSTSKNGTYKEIAAIKGGSTTTYTDKRLKTGTTYYYQLRSYKGSGKKEKLSSYSSKRSCKPIPSAVTMKDITKYNSKKLKLSWKSVSGADGYEIYRSDAKKGTYKRIRTVSGKNSTTYNTTYLKEKTYYYKMRAYRMMKGTKVYGSYSKISSYRE